MRSAVRILWRVAAAAILLWSSNAYAGAYAGFKYIEKNGCNACHNLTGEVGLNTVGLWRKGPDLYDAGVKYNQHWIAKWLQNPTRIRPAGTYYLDHAQTGVKWNTIRTDSLEPHVQLSAQDAENVAESLSELRGKIGLVRAEKHDPSVSYGSLGEMQFDKAHGCLACHSIEPSYGGLSGPEMYTAGERLKPEYMLSYMRDPQAWNHKTWMPASGLSEDDMQKTVNYIISLSTTADKEAVQNFAQHSAANNYRIYCMQCHGISGKGSGINARNMSVPPRNHSDAKYLKARTDEELFKVIKEGGLSMSKSALMPAWGQTLSDVEIHDLVEHVRKLCKCEFEGQK